MEQDINFLEEENEPLGRAYSMELLIVLMLLVMALIYFGSRIFVIIPAGHKGALYQTFWGGTQLHGEYYDEGLHIMFPWDEMILYNTRILEHQDTVLALTEDGLNVSAEISYRYFPDYTRIGRLHREIGPEYLYSILVPHITAITRDVISHYRVDHLYNASRDTIQMEMTQRCQRQITDNYPISVIDVVVRNIELPEDLMNAIEKKLVWEQTMLEYHFRIKVEEQEAERKLISAKGIKNFRDTSGIDILQWEGIRATKEISQSPNSKVIIMGNDTGELPVILGGDN